MSESRELVNYDAQLAAQAQAYAEQEQRSVTFLSTRGGVLKMGDEELPGNQALVIVLDSVKENTFYANKFDPDNLESPICYAFGRGKDDMAPHESMQVDLDYFKPQVQMPDGTCATCPKNEWGSADTGRGKACQNRRRLAIIPAGYYEPVSKGSKDLEPKLFNDPATLQEVDMAFIKISPTSLESWSKYVTQLSAAHRLPPHGVVTRLFLTPHPKHQYHINFEVVEVLSPELIPAVMARHEQAVAAVIQGYSPPQERDDAPRGSLKGLRNGR